MSDFLSAVGEIATNESAYRNAAIAAVVLLFAASGELVAEKAGTINISLEGDDARRRVRRRGRPGPHRLGVARPGCSRMVAGVAVSRSCRPT